MTDFPSPNTLSKVRVNDAFNNWTTVETTVDRWQRSMTQRTTVPGQMYDALESYLNGQLLSVSDSAGNTTDFAYDTAGRVIMQVDPRIGPSHPTSFEYYPNSAQLKTVTNPDGTKIGYVYNGLNGRMIHQTFTPSGGGTVQNTRFAYDSAGNTIRVWSNATNPVKYVYNDLNQMTEIYTYRTGSTWTGTGMPTEFDTLPGDKTIWNYQSTTGLLTSKRDAANKGNTFVYDDLNRVATRTDGRNVVTSYSYYDYAYHGSKQFTGMLRDVSYNTSADPSTIATPTVSYAYRRNLSPSTITDAIGTRAFGYYDDPVAGYFTKSSSMLPKTETLAPFYYGKQIEYDYQFGGPNQLSGVRNRLQFDAMWQYNVMFEYNDVNRLSAVIPTHESWTPFNHYYLPNSNLIQVIDRNGGSRVYTYEPHSDRLDRVVSDYGSVRLADVMPHYDGYGRLYYTETLGSVVTGLGGYGSYGAMQYQQYTDRNEISLSVKHQVSTPSSYPNDNGTWGSVVAKSTSENGYRAYNYDPIGNRMLEDEHANASYGSQTPIAVNSLNQYTTYANKSFTYDANGNLKSDGARNYTYDAENNLVDVTPISPVVGDLKIFNQYDYLGRRVLKRVWEWSGAWTLRQDLSSRLVYDGWNLIAELDDNGNVKKKYTWGNDVSGTAQGAGGVGGLLMIELANGPSFEQLYPIYDSRHNIIGLHNSVGAIVARYDYDAFGEIFNVNGTAFSGYGDTNYAEANPFRYSTKYTDNYSSKFGDGDAYRDGMIYYGLRFYVPETGRFLNRDPIEESGGLSLYGFVGNSPTNVIDYLGMWPKWLGGDGDGGSPILSPGERWRGEDIPDSPRDNPGWTPIADDRVPWSMDEWARNSSEFDQRKWDERARREQLGSVGFGEPLTLNGWTPSDLNVGAWVPGTAASLNGVTYVTVNGNRMGFSMRPPPGTRTPPGGSTSLAFLFKPNSPNSMLRLDSGFNTVTNSSNFHWNQKGVYSIFKVSNHATRGASLAGYMTVGSKLVGRVALPLGIVQSGYAIQNSPTPGREAVVQASGWASAWAGAWAGAKGGAIIGAAGGAPAGGVGAAPGAVIGGVIGGIAGGMAGWWGGTSAAKSLLEN